ncbi:MAG: hypothetical protein GSR79_06325 [Desulfurococcales archaeon]|nr:hypothetical protein [Desulfurococcales archaeon]
MLEIIGQARQYHDIRLPEAREIGEKTCKLPETPYQWFRDLIHYDLPGVNYLDL